MSFLEVSKKKFGGLAFSPVIDYLMTTVKVLTSTSTES